MTSQTNNTLTAVAGIRVGHVTDLAGGTGCTVILCPPNTVGGVDQRGGAPGTRETDLLRPMHLVQYVDALLLAGGSAFGLAAADGVMRWLRAQGRGYPTSAGVAVPIVPGAILFDLDVGDANAFPTAESGYAACDSARDAPVADGSVGAGTGARIGALMDAALATKGGVGSACARVNEHVIVAALMVVNTVGDVVEDDGTILAGLRADDGSHVGLLNVLGRLSAAPPVGQNTLIGVVATNAALTKDHANKMAQMAHDGVARAVRPAHTMWDGDTIFALATGQAAAADVSAVGAFAAEVTAHAIRNAVRAATSLHGVRAAHDR